MTRKEKRKVRVRKVKKVDERVFELAMGVGSNSSKEDYYSKPSSVTSALILTSPPREYNL